MTPPHDGLSSIEAQARLARDGPNEIAPIRPHPLLDLLRKFWAPIPWLLEGTIVLALATNRSKDAVAVTFLLVFNVFLAFVQERRAQRALDLLRARIVVHAKVLRDGIWGTLASRELVVDDIVRLIVGDVVPADIALDDGELQIDRSALTGESVPEEVTAGQAVYAGSTVTRGDATGHVVATAERTKFGKTAGLMRDIRTVGSVQRLVMGIVRSLAIAGVIVVLGVAAFAFSQHVARSEIVVFALVVMLAAIPVALPAAFTLATALGALELSHSGVLVTHLTAMEDAASMDVLCSDKTGTLTLNAIRVDRTTPYPPYSEAELLRFARATCDVAGQDPIDIAILATAQATPAEDLHVERLIPFDPQTKSAQALVRFADGSTATIAKGAPSALGIAFPTVEALAASGDRAIGVTIARNAQTVAVGAIGLADPPRPDAAKLVAAIAQRGVEVRMVTGDAPETALHVAAQIGIPSLSVDASVFPDQKLQIVQREQAKGRIVGMTGDGINDAPSLRAANVGIAVSNATDVAKAAASIILTRPGLDGVLAAIDTSRRIYQRMLTYVVAKIVKYFEIVFVTSIGFFAFRHFVLSPTLMVALLILNDFATLSIATDRVAPSRGFDAWHVGRLVAAAAVLAVFTASSIVAFLLYQSRSASLDLAQIRGLTFFSMVGVGQIALLALRERDAVFREPPSRFLAGAIAFAVLAAAAMALFGALMPPLPPVVVGEGVAFIFGVGGILFAIKLPIYRAFGIGRATKAPIPP
ncbi:MAG: HAD-IC family P-type ATPase [Candidatus Baltobacteraceae bacterium]